MWLIPLSGKTGSANELPNFSGFNLGKACGTLLDLQGTLNQVMHRCPAQAHRATSDFTLVLSRAAQN